MQNGHALNGAAHGAPQPVSINPLQAAQFALMFLHRADMKASERDAFAVAEGLLNAILSGQVVLSPPAETPAPPAPQPPAPSPAPSPVPPQPET